MPDNQENNGLKKFYDFGLWTNAHISFLTQYHLVLFAVSSAALGFEANLIVKQDFTLKCTGKVFFIASVLALLVSVGVSLVMFKKRSGNFRKNAKIARKLVHGADAQNLLEETARVNKSLDKLEFWQFLLFAVGILSLIVSLACNYNDKLF